MTAWMVAAVLLGGGLAATVRYALAAVLPRRGDERGPDDRGASRRSPWIDLPRAVLLVNTVASLVAGTAAGAAQANDLPAWVVTAIVTGIAGGLSTFSTLAVDTVDLARTGRAGLALTNVVANVVLGITLAAIGFVVGSNLVL